MRLALGCQKVVDRNVDIAADLTQQNWRDVATSVHWDRGGAPVWMTKLFVRPALSYFQEAQSLEARDDLARLENG